MRPVNAKRLAAAALLGCLLAGPASELPAATTASISQLPVDTRSQVRPNILFVLDDSGSMDFDILLTNTNDGALWWDTTAGSFVETLNNVLSLNFNCVGTQGNGVRDLASQTFMCQPGTSTTGTTWYKFGYLFPNGVGDTANGGVYDRIMGDGTYSHYAIAPPSPQLRDAGTVDGFKQDGVYAAMRSSDYNPTYFNPSLTYKPWQPAYLGGASVTFSNATTTAAKSHPYFSTSGHDLTSSATFYQTTAGWTFRFLPGMVIPVGLVNGSQVQGKCLAGSSTACKNAGSFKALSGLGGVGGTTYTVPSGELWDVAIAYYPATYYQKVTSCTPIQDATGRTNCAKPTACTATGAVCYQAYDGNWLLEVQISNSAGDAAKLQNFANWFQYHRKHKLLLASAMGDVLTPINSVRSGVAAMNHLPSSVTVYDLSSTTPATNVQALLAPIYLNPSNGGTPTRPALNFLGQQFMTNSNIIQYACQTNAAMVLTDGFAQADTSVSPPSYDATIWMKASPPFQTIVSSSLADIAASYYTNNLNTSYTTGQVPVDPSATGPSADTNRNLHMLTYGFTLGTPGILFAQPAYQAFNNNPYDKWPTSVTDWPKPDADRNPSGIDDLWHAALNGRGQMFIATDAQTASDAIQNMITNVLVKSGSLASLGVSARRIVSGSVAYRGSYNANAWFGDVIANPIDPATGNVNTSSTYWTADALLDATTPTSRLIAIHDQGTNATYSFDSTSLPSTVLGKLNSSSTSSDGATVVNWLRGDRSLEGTTYRTRIHLLGDVVNAAPVYVGGPAGSYSDVGYSSFAVGVGARAPMLYVAANDGMLHAFDASVGGTMSGHELWAWVPSFVIPSLSALAQKSYTHQFYLDATPTAADVDLCNTSKQPCGTSTTNWRTILVGGQGAGGHGFYALDVTNGPTVTSVADVQGQFLWEFPGPNTSAAVVAELGYSYTIPVIAKTAAYGWVVLVTSGYNNSDGHGHLFVLDAATGGVLADLVTTGGPTLAQITAAVTSASNQTITRVYGGDLDGKLWRFDLSGPNTSSSPWTVTQLASLVDGAGNAQPITSAPQVGLVKGNYVVYLGTGMLLSNADLSTTSTQTLYALMDDSRGPIVSLRTNLLQHTWTSVNSTTGEATTNTITMDWTKYRGWYIDLSLTAGERVLSQPALNLGFIRFDSNAPSGTACASNSYRYQIAYDSGNPTVPAREAISTTLASAPVIVQLADGTLAELIHLADGTVKTVPLPKPSAAGFAKAGWRDVTR